MKYLQSKYLKKARICSYLSLHKNIPYAAQTGRFWHYPCGGKEKSFLDVAPGAMIGLVQGL